MQMNLVRLTAFCSNTRWKKYESSTERVHKHERRKHVYPVDLLREQILLVQEQDHRRFAEETIITNFVEEIDRFDHSGSGNDPHGVRRAGKSIATHGDDRRNGLSASMPPPRLIENAERNTSIGALFEEIK